MTAAVAATPAAPVSAVLAQFEAGATSLADISAATGLPIDVVRLAVDRLVAMSRLTAEQLTAGCPADDCGGCGFAGSACAPSSRRGPVLLRLSR